VIALDRGGVMLDLPRHPLHHILRVRAVADEVAKEDQPVDMLTCDMGEAGIERLAIGMNV
jgi:hypothetical protein